jgi:uncharacterized protein (TIGR00266 family)
MEQLYYADAEGTQQGPVSLEDLESLLNEGIVTTETLVWYEGLEEWQPLAQALNLTAEPAPDEEEVDLPPPLPPGTYTGREGARESTQTPASGLTMAIATSAASVPSPSPSSAAPSEATTVGVDTREFDYTIECRPDFSFLRVQLPAGKTLKVEASAMATMDTNLSMKTKFKGGLSRFLTGESIFLNEFTAENAPGEIGIAPGPPGDLEHVHLNGNILYLQNSAFVASGMEVVVETKWQGLAKGFFSGESLFLIRCSGQGDLWFNTYGSMFEIDVNGQYVVDTGHIVAFTDGLEYSVTRIGGYKSLFLSGEGLVCRFTGQGKVWIQTRKVSPFAWWVHPFRPVKSSN